MPIPAILRMFGALAVLVLVPAAGAQEEQGRADKVEKAAAQVMYALSDHLGPVDVGILERAMVEWGDAGVPWLIATYSGAGEQVQRHIALCLGVNGSVVARAFLRAIIAAHERDLPTGEAIRSYPVAHEDEIVEPVIALIAANPTHAAGWEAEERSHHLFDRRPRRIADLVTALQATTDDEVAERLNALLRYVTGAFAGGLIRDRRAGLVRFWTAWLARNGERESLEWLLEAMASPVLQVRTDAMQRLYSLHDRRTLPYFLAQLDDPEDAVRYDAIYGLRDLDDELDPSVRALGFEAFKAGEPAEQERLRRRWIAPLGPPPPRPADPASASDVALNHLLAALDAARAAREPRLAPGTYHRLAKTDIRFMPLFAALPGGAWFVDRQGVAVDGWGHPLTLIVEPSVVAGVSGGPDGDVATTDDNVIRLLPLAADPR